MGDRLALEGWGLARSGGIPPLRAREFAVGVNGAEQHRAVAELPQVAVDLGDADRLAMSFTEGRSLKFPPPGFSLQWYAVLFDAAQSRQIHRAAGNSLQVAAIATTVAAVFGTLAALGLAHARSRWARVADTLFMSPLILPALAFGLAALMYFTFIGLRPSLELIMLGHAVVIVPFVLRTASASLTQLNPALLESSASLGASRLYTFRRVTLPLIRPGVLAGAFIAFMSSFDNVPVSLFLRDARTDMLPIRMWQDLEGKLDVTIAAVSGVLIVLTVALMILMESIAGLSRRLR
jgi:putative spermidine/putrescine transport system permease protein